MYLIECNKRELRRGYRKTKLLALLDNFRDSGIECAKVEGAAEHYVSAAIGRNTLNRSIQHFGYHGIKAIVRNGEVYLINTMQEGE